MGSTVVKKSLKKENHRAEGAIKRLEETQKRERRKNEDLQKEPLASHIKRGEWNDALLEACKIGNKEIVELMIEKGADNWNYGLFGACEGGNKEIVELIIGKGANNWNCGLKGACEGGNKEIIELMIEKGAEDWDWGLQGASSVSIRYLLWLFSYYPPKLLKTV